MALDPAHAPGDENANDCQQDDDGKHAAGFEVRRQYRERLTEAVLRSDDLATDNAQQREHEAKPQPVEDDRHRAWQREFPEDLRLTGPQCTRQYDVIGIDTTTTGHRVGEYNEESERKPYRDLGADPQTEPNDEKRGERNARHSIEREQDGAQHRLDIRLRDEQHADKNSGDTAGAERNHRRQHGVAKIFEQALSDENFRPQVPEDSGWAPN